MPTKVAKIQSTASGADDNENETSEIIYSLDIKESGKPKLNNHFKKGRKQQKKRQKNFIHSAGVNIEDVEEQETYNKASTPQVRDSEAMVMVQQPVDASERALVQVQGIKEVDEEEQERTHMNEIVMKFDDDDEAYLKKEIKDLKQQVRALPSSQVGHSK